MPHIEVDGAELYYEITGSGPVVVLLNGIFQRVERWEPLLPELPGYRVVRYDMRGQGRSSVPPGPYTPAVHARDLRQLIAAIGAPRHRLVGLSNGGVVAMTYALDAGAQARGLDGLALVCTTAHLDVALRAKLRSWLDAVRSGGVRLRVQVSLPWAFGRAFLEAHPELLEASALDAAVLGAPDALAHERLLTGLLSLGDLRAELATIDVPVCVISGEDDLLFPPRHGAEIAARVPGATFVALPGVGHQPPLEDPVAFGAALRDFLRS